HEIHERVASGAEGRRGAHAKARFLESKTHITRGSLNAIDDFQQKAAQPRGGKNSTELCFRRPQWKNEHDLLFRGIALIQEALRAGNEIVVRHLAKAIRSGTVWICSYLDSCIWGKEN